MTVIACPKCKDEVRVPARASAQATVRCPLCSEEYLLGDALAQLPPELIVISGMADADSELDPYRSPAPIVEPDPGADYRMAGAPAGVAAGVFDTAGPGASGAAVARPLRTARPKRKEKNMVAEMVKVVLGGVVGISLAIPIIWWGPMLWGGKGSDPFALGPMVSPYAPWLVPAQFHGRQAIRPALDDTTGAAPSKPAKQPKLQTFDDTPGSFDPGGKFASALSGKTEAEEPPLSGGVNTAPFAPEEPVLTIDDPLAPAKSKTTDEPVIEDPLTALGSPKTLPEVSPKSEPPPTPNLDDLNPPEAPKAPKKKGKPKTKSTPKAEPKNEPMPESAIPSPVPPTATEPASAADLSKSLEKATAARAAFDKAYAEGADAPTRRDLGTELFDAASAIGPVVAQMSVEDADNYDQIMALKEFLTSFGNARDLAVLAFLADKKLTEAAAGGTAGNAGIVVGGTVKDFKSVGSAFETTVELAGGKRSVQVVTFKNPQDQCKIDDRIVLVGRVVSEPKTNLKGYEGEEPLVVNAAYLTVLPAAE